VTQESLRARRSRWSPRTPRCCIARSATIFRYGPPGQQRRRGDRRRQARPMRTNSSSIWSTGRSAAATDAQVGETRRQALRRPAASASRIRARVILRNAPILVLGRGDLGARQRGRGPRFQSSLGTLMAGKTVIAIAHRAVDHRPHGPAGRARSRAASSSRGTHHELLRHGGHYAALWQRAVRRLHRRWRQGRPRSESYPSPWWGACQEGGMPPIPHCFFTVARCS